MRLLAGPDFSDIDNPRIKIAVLTRQPRVNSVGDKVRDPAPIAAFGHECLADKLLLADNVPKPKFYPDTAIPLAFDRANDEALGIDLPPIRKAWCQYGCSRGLG